MRKQDWWLWGPAARRHEKKPLRGPPTIRRPSRFARAFDAINEGATTFTIHPVGASHEVFPSWGCSVQQLVRQALLAGNRLPRLQDAAGIGRFGNPLFQLGERDLKRRGQLILQHFLTVESLAKRAKPGMGYYAYADVSQESASSGFLFPCSRVRRWRVAVESPPDDFLAFARRSCTLAATLFFIERST